MFVISGDNFSQSENTISIIKFHCIEKVFKHTLAVKGCTEEVLKNLRRIYLGKKGTRSAEESNGVPFLLISIQTMMFSFLYGIVC